MKGIVKLVQNRLKPFLSQFMPDIKSCRSQKLFQAYVNGQLSDIDRKNMESIAVEMEVEPRCLQSFLSCYRWDHDKVVKTLHDIVINDHTKRGLKIGTIDETSDKKNGAKTPGVGRQYLGSVGKTDNGIVTVHLGYVNAQFHTMLHGDLYMPEDWFEDRSRCRAAGIPDDLEFKTKLDIALELHEKSTRHGIVFDYLTFDALYGRSVPFLQELDRRNQKFVADVPSSFHVWCDDPPPVTDRPYRKSGRGRGRKTPRLRADASSSISLKKFLESSKLGEREWCDYKIKETQKGPMVWRVQRFTAWLKDENGLPWDKPCQLLIAQNVQGKKEVKCFVSNAPPETKTVELLKVAFSRWTVERCFQDQKQEIGWGDYQGRVYTGLIRHLILSSVSYLFLNTVKSDLKKTYPELTVCQVQQVTRAIFRAEWAGYPITSSLCDKLDREIALREKSNAKARMYHRKRRMNDLQKLGIDPDALPSCESVK